MHVYVHVPFCARRCSYCDFAIAVRRVVPSRRFVEAVLQEWSGWQSHPAWDGSPRVDTVYFGGGTPSRLEPAAIAALMAGLAGAREIASGAEVTLEANPDDVTPAAAKAWRAAGVNRVSLGAQSFDPAVLAWMHRTHTVGQIGTAVEVLRAAGIAELSLDLIFGLPAALGRDWDRDLAMAFALAPDHLSLYGLTVEDHTPLARWTARGEVAPVDEERYAAEFLAANVALLGNGFEHYEVSNAARPGRRARHNSAYWRRAPFLGLGPSAHSGLGRERRWNVRDWAAYDRLLSSGAAVIEGSEHLSDAAVALEEIYLGLRTTGGIPAGRLATDTMAAWTGAGWGRVDPDGRVRLTVEGWLRLDALVASAAAVVSDA
ncbi:MAG TPA: radical SAM family heme chaperone HemW [Gemmatimonadales bacterium]|nr:radical SAM family heme chaperone HemW [Gemmatimonadales bacterium]